MQSNKEEERSAKERLERDNQASRKIKKQQGKMVNRIV